MSHNFVILLIDPESKSGWEWETAASRAGLERRLYRAATGVEAAEYILKARGSPSLSMPSVVLVQSPEPEVLSPVIHWLRSQQELAWVIPIALVPPHRMAALAQFYEAGARSCLPSPNTIEAKTRTLTEIRLYWESFNVRPRAS